METGGTICMRVGPHGLAPAPDVVRGALVGLLTPPEAGALRVETLDPLVDSADVGPVVWNRMLDGIEKAEGPVIITHGTDTMAFTGAALDAALAGMERCVVLCGSMHPLGTGGDAEGNLDLALGLARAGTPGVHLAFDGRVLPGGALAKVHSSTAAAFAPAGDPAPVPAPPARRFDSARALGIVTITPGLTPDALAAMLAPLEGAVLRVFGAGTVPAGLAAPLAAASARGCRVVAVSQCAAGGLEPGAYAAGAGIWAAGVENGGPLSPEQALTRLWLRLSVGQKRG